MIKLTHTCSGEILKSNMLHIIQMYCDHERHSAFSDGKMYVVCPKCKLQQVFDFSEDND